MRAPTPYPPSKVVPAREKAQEPRRLPPRKTRRGTLFPSRSTCPPETSNHRSVTRRIGPSRHQGAVCVVHVQVQVLVQVTARRRTQGRARLAVPRQCDTDARVGAGDVGLPQLRQGPAPVTGGRQGVVGVGRSTGAMLAPARALSRGSTMARTPPAGFTDAQTLEPTSTPLADSHVEVETSSSPARVHPRRPLVQRLLAGRCLGRLSPARGSEARSGIGGQTPSRKQAASCPAAPIDIVPLPRRGRAIP